MPCKLIENKKVLIELSSCYIDIIVSSKMSKSVLSRRIDICNSISKLNEDGCLDVIRLIQNVMRLDDLNELTTKTFMDYSNDCKIDQIIQFDNEIKQRVSNRRYCHSDSQSHKKKTIPNINNNIKFPLLRLPIDLITQTSLYLNEKDIFKFECCCRLFYQMINNASYLSLSNNFKTFEITNDILTQMSQTQCSFFKYTKAKQVKLYCNSGVESNGDDRAKIEDCVTKLRTDWEKTAKQVCINDGGWLNNMFKSIERLDINYDSMTLLDKLPIDILFDPINESHLNEIHFDYWNQHDEKYLTHLQYIDKFAREYLNIQRRLDKQNKEMRQLKMITHDNIVKAFEGLFYILVDHLHIDLSWLPQIDLTKNLLSPHYNACLRKLSFDLMFFLIVKVLSRNIV